MGFRVLSFRPRLVSVSQRRRLAAEVRMLIILELSESNSFRMLSCLCWSLRLKSLKWGFPKIRGTILGVPIIRTIVFWGLYWGPLILGNYQMEFRM